MNPKLVELAFVPEVHVETSQTGALPHFHGGLSKAVMTSSRRFW
jgi:hypothetical protein